MSLYIWDRSTSSRSDSTTCVEENRIQDLSSVLEEESQTDFDWFMQNEKIVNLKKLKANIAEKSLKWKAVAPF